MEGGRDISISLNHNIFITYLSSRIWSPDSAVFGQYESHLFSIRYRRYEWLIDKRTKECIHLNDQISKIYPHKSWRGLQQSFFQKYCCMKTNLSGEEMQHFFEMVLNDNELFSYRFIRIFFGISGVSLRINIIFSSKLICRYHSTLNLAAKERKELWERSTQKFAYNIFC